jgi:putative DNA primase/helicase
MFSETAPAYWAAGIPVIPLRPRSKIPAPTAWQAFASKMPDADTQAQWLLGYPDGNVGLPLGSQSGMLAIDLDSDDPQVLKILMDLMPPVLWKRVGKKGAVYMYRFNGERTTRIKGEDGNTIVEILSSGTQVVLPPSIHPDTQRPYEANCELLSVASKLSVLPRDFETLLRTALIAGGYKLTTRGSNKVTDWVPAGGRDSAMTGFAGLQARSVVKGDRSLLEAFHEMEVWIGTFTEKVSGDTLDPEKGRGKIMEFLRRDVVEGKRKLPTRWCSAMTPEEEKEAKIYLGEDVEAWTVTQILDHLEERFTEIPVESVMQRTEAIDGALIRMIKSEEITAMQQDIILSYIMKASARTVTMGSLRKRLADLVSGEIEGTDHTEIAKAAIKEVERYGECRTQGGSIYQWRGSHWVQMLEADWMNLISEEFGDLQAARKHSDHRGVMRTIEYLLPRGLVENAVIGINFANGYLSIDGELLDHHPKFGATYVMPYRYLPEGAAPQRFLGLLDQSWGHNHDYMDKIQALREAIAATLFKVAPQHSRAFLLFGVAHSGKSTLKSVVEGLVPSDAVCSVPPHDWSDRFLPTMMVDKLVNFCGELSESQLIQGDRFKSIVEGDEMSGQLKGGQIFKFRPLCAHWFASNHLPRTRDTSAGFNRRWLILEFDRPVPVAQKIIGLGRQILDEEREAIVAWAIGAMTDLHRNQDYTLPASHQNLVSEVASQNNSVRFFMISGGVQVQRTTDGGISSVRTSEKELYSAYFAFCRVVANALPVQLKKFRLVMGELQSELGFTLVKEVTSMGEECWYHNITPVTQRRAA